MAQKPIVFATHESVANVVWFYQSLVITKIAFNFHCFNANKHSIKIHKILYENKLFVIGCKCSVRLNLYANKNKQKLQKLVSKLVFEFIMSLRCLLLLCGQVEVERTTINKSYPRISPIIDWTFKILDKTQSDYRNKWYYVWTKKVFLHFLKA